MSSSLIHCIEEEDAGPQKKYINVGVQVDNVCLNPANRYHQTVDLGYDSLHSTPKQHPIEDKKIQNFEIEDDDEDNISGSTSNSFKWKKRFTKFRSCKLSSICRSRKPTEGSSTSMELKTTLPKDVIIEEPPERVEWDEKMDFLLSIIGFAVDLANVWRFPYLCYKNGGGVFLIPYTLMLIFGALPLFFMELSLGQFAKAGPISLWTKICPAMKGVGYCCVLISWYVSFYYNVIIGWTLYFIVTTLTSGPLLPWQHCNNKWNTRECFAVNQVINSNCTENCTAQAIQAGNCSSDCFDEDIAWANRTSAAQEFFERGVLQINRSEGLHDMGALRPELVGCVGCVFIILYFSLFKGVKSSGKVVWVTATAPYIILTILLVRGLFLPGAGSGILYYLSPRLEKLKDPQVWTDAATQVFFSVGVGFGVHLTYASFNKFNNNCYRDCLLTAVVNSLTSFYSGFVIFTYLGYMAQSMRKEIQNVASEGYGLVFQVYPEAISTLPMAKFWSILFFFMLVTLGLDSAMGGLEAVITGLLDEFQFKHIKREHFTAIVLCTSFLGCLINCTQGGGYTMHWFDSYSAGVSLLCSALFEAIAITYFYGLDKFCDNIESMIGHRPSQYWQICWKYITPVFLLIVVILNVISMDNLSFYGYDYPLWATVLGWMLSASSVAAIPIFAIIYWIKKLFKNTNDIQIDKVKHRSLEINSSKNTPIFV